MQYHLNGFKPGNYQIPDSIRKPAPSDLENEKMVEALFKGKV